MGRRELMESLPWDSEIVRKFREGKVDCECGSWVQACSLKGHKRSEKHARLMREKVRKGPDCGATW